MSGPTRDLGNGGYGINHVDTSSRLTDGTITATTSAAVLGPEQPCVEILLQAEDGAIRAGSATSQSHLISTGERVVIPVTNVNLVYVKSVSGSVRVNYWARGG